MLVKAFSVSHHRYKLPKRIFDERPTKPVISLKQLAKRKSSAKNDGSVIRTTTPCGVPLSNGLIGHTFPLTFF